MSFLQEKAKAFKEFIEILKRYDVELLYSKKIFKCLLEDEKSLSSLLFLTNEFMRTELYAWKERYAKLLNDERIIESL